MQNKTKEEMIKEALERDTEITRAEYAEKIAQADKITAAHGIDGEAPISEEERERRMRMNYYGTVINIVMSMLSAIDDLASRITVLNNNIVAAIGGEANGANGNTSD